MEVDLDDSAWPIVVARWRESPRDFEIRPLLAKMDEWLARGRFGLLIDGRGTSGFSPEQRAELLAHMRANAALTRKRLVQAVVIDNLAVRTLFYGVSLIYPLPFANKVFGDAVEARRWLESMLASQPPGDD